MKTRRSLFASLSLAAAVAAFPGRPAAQGTGRQEAERRRILDQLGLEKKEKPPAPPAAETTGEPPADKGEGGAAPPSEGAPAPGTAPAAPPPPPFKGRVHQLLLTSCRSCHGAGGPAAGTRLVLDGNAERDHAAARRLVDLRNPRRSLLFTKATGIQHGGGPTLAAGGEPARRLLQWIAGGAAFAAEAPPAAPGAAVPPPPPASGARRGRRAPAFAAEAPPPAEPPAPEAVPAEPPVSSAPAPETAFPTTQPALPAPLPAVAIQLHAALLRSCRSCHTAGAMAGATRFVLTGAIEKDLGMSRGFVVPSDPPASPLVTKAAGKLHGGGGPWPEGSADRATLLAWIAAGAPAAPPAPASPLSSASPVGEGAEPPPTTSPVPPPIEPPPAPVAPPPPRHPGGHAHRSPLAVSFWGQTLALNGRFDLNLERRQFQTNPFADQATNALQSYHHFLFLNRSSTEDPFTFTVELVNLTFFEMAARLAPRTAPCYLNLRAGRLLVPFGAEPLFHQSYGGHLGFDQRVLPAILTSEAVAVTGGARIRGLSFHGDLFAMKGYELRREDAVLNLKTDFSPVDQARVAIGGRLGLGAGPLSVYYSALGNRLGFDRFLFLQALDVSLWRLRGVPVLAPVFDRLVLAAGFLRGDVSGGGAGDDYYHVATYWLARAYLYDWLSIQYRQGMRMLGNRRGFWGDDTRLGPEDGSTHNFSLIARYHGLQMILSYYLNLEKAGEIDDDLLRLQVAFEF